MRLPASPMSFSSNNISISGSSVLDGSSIVQQSPHQDQTSQQIGQRQQHQATSSATSQPTGLPGQVSSAGSQVPSSLNQEPNSLLPLQKKPRLDILQEDILQQQVIQQLLHRQDPVQGHNPHLQALLQQQKIMQQRQHLLQTMPQIQRAHMQQQQQQQMRQHLQQGVHPSTAIRRPYDSGICARRLMQYIYHQRHRPADNSILYWRKFVAEYFASRAKKRWCLSLYDSVGHHALGVFPQASMDAWHCDICGSKSGRGFETTYEVLPRLSKIKFDSGVVDELLFLDMPHEYRFHSGLMMLEYGKAIQESVYEQLRVVREGQLRIIFTPDLKILSWEFCARCHEELLPRRLVAPQVNQLVQVAQKYQSAVNEGGSAGVSTQDLQTNCNMFVTAGRQLARNLDLQSLNDLGFSKRYVRCLQISEVVCSMKDLIDFSRENNMGPIESLKSYPRQAAQAKLQVQKMQEMEQLVNARGLPADQCNLNKIMAMHPGLSTQMNNNQMNGGNPNSSAVQSAVAVNNYQNLLRQNSMNSSSNNAVHGDASTSFNNPNQAQSLPFQSAVSSMTGSTLQNATLNGQPGAHPPQNLIKQGQPSSQGNQHLQQHMIQQLLQEMMNNNNGGVQQTSLGGQNTTTNSADDVFAGTGGTGSLVGRVGPNMVGFGNNTSNVHNNSGGFVPSRNNSFKTVSSSSPTVSGNSFNLRQDAVQNLHLPELVQDIPRQFSDHGLFNDEGFGWKS
ncbi:probable transcriptional regulator SLK2 [Aristolochia californica]|uniref:probable transcriptional regulator SLK2 n=1 Tax=Aristolochia californica TaxID=171875 RepID=UPI0035DBB72B